jgi:enoyl-CoA hydratase/carnithine racemase
VSDPRLELVIADGIAFLTIRRADKLNALDAAMVDGLIPLCRQIERSDAFVVIFLRRR